MLRLREQGSFTQGLPEMRVLPGQTGNGSGNQGLIPAFILTVRSAEWTNCLKK
jgi:hypothetical protein